MPCLRQTSDTVKPLARSRSASRSSRSICSALRRLLISPSLDSSQRTTITTGPTFGEPTIHCFLQTCADHLISPRDLSWWHGWPSRVLPWDRTVDLLNAPVLSADLG